MYKVYTAVHLYTVYMWLDSRKPGFHAQLQIFRNTEFKYYNSGREADACLKFATIL